MAALIDVFDSVPEYLVMAGRLLMLYKGNFTDLNVKKRFLNYMRRAVVIKLSANGVTVKYGNSHTYLCTVFDIN